MISIVTPTYNRKDMLKDVIESSMKQSYSDFEIIIVDDCSSDGTDEFIKAYESDERIRYFRNKKNMGPGYNRNFGFKQAKGDYVIFMDDDDYYTDFDFFKKAIEVFENNRDKNLAFVSANSYVHYYKKDKKSPANIGHVGYIDGMEFLFNLKIKYNKPQSTFTTLFSRDILIKADLENMEMVNDYAIYLRSLLYGNAYIIEDRIGVYRVHSNNISSHIECDFLIQNLEERAWVKNHMKENVDQKRVKKWWKIQMLTLLKYYLFGSIPKFRDGFAVAKWIIKNSGFAPDLFIIVCGLLLSYKIYGLARYIKKTILK